MIQEKHKHISPYVPVLVRRRTLEKEAKFKHTVEL